MQTKTPTLYSVALNMAAQELGIELHTLSNNFNWLRKFSHLRPLTVVIDNNCLPLREMLRVAASLLTLLPAPPTDEVELDVPDLIKAGNLGPIGFYTTVTHLCGEKMTNSRCNDLYSIRILARENNWTAAQTVWVINQLFGTEISALGFVYAMAVYKNMIDLVEMQDESHR